MNSVILIGRLTRDPETRYTSGSQMAVCTFTIAIDRGKDKDGNNKGADFPKVTVFGKQAENCERFLKSGRLVCVQGRIQTASYVNKDGKTIYTTDVIADRVEFLEKPEMTTQAAAPEPAKEQEYVPEAFEQIQEDIPF